MHAIDNPFKSVRPALLVRLEGSDRDGGGKWADLEFDRFGIGMNSIVGCAAQHEREPKAKGTLVWAIGQVILSLASKERKGTAWGGAMMAIAPGPATAIVASTVLVAVLITETRFSFET
jgi:hypothetical protein